MRKVVSKPSAFDAGTKSAVFMMAGIRVAEIGNLRAARRRV
jgi:hypothetical protein